MSSPGIDLDMDLDSPSWNDRDNIIANTNGNSDERCGIHLTSLDPNAARDGLATIAKDDAGLEMLDSSQEAARALTESATADETKPSAGDLEEMSELVESWKEEINMLTVKNAILLDDLVKVGADVY